MAEGTRIGDPVARVDGIAKVTGTAQFPSDVPAQRAAHAVLITSTIALGSIRSIDPASAEKVPGFLLLLTHENTQGEMKTPRAFAGNSTTTVESPRIMHDGQIIGLVAAEKLEDAREAARLVQVDYEPAMPSAGFDAAGATTRRVAEINSHHEDAQVGDAETALRQAAASIDVSYSTPTQHHNPMELFTTTVWWAGNRLTVHEPSQFVLDRGFLAECFQMEVEDIRVVSRFCGGGFGGKFSGTPRTVLAAIAARRLGRPVKLAASRDQGFTIGTYRAETRQRLRLGADKTGQLAALSHEGWEVSSRPSHYTVAGTETTARMYACPNIWTGVNVVQADRNTPGFMRCPAELPYMFGLESAMDELAWKLGMDPVALRLKNDTMVDPIDGRQYSSRSLRQCLKRGAELFGWSERVARPREMREGDWLVGWGMATACYPANNGAATVRIRLDGEARARVQVAFHEIGNGAYTVIAQSTAALLGIPLGQVSVELGDTLLPAGNIAAASSGTAGTINAVAAACADLRARLAGAATAAGGPLAGADPQGIELHGGQVIVGSRQASLVDVVGAAGGMVEVTGNFIPQAIPPGALDRLRKGIPAIAGGVHAKGFVAYAFGAEFVEVRVHALTGEVRVPRATGVFAAGRIINRRTVHSQLTGGMIWGLSSALFEQTLVDPHSARYLNDSLGDYLIPTHADIGAITVETIDEVDELINPLGIKGVGELGCSGTNAAVANAVYHATGKRVRDLPIRAHQLI